MSQLAGLPKLAGFSLLLALLVLLPFVGKPFTIDDVVFLLQAQHVLQDPLHPTAFEMVFHGERIRMSNYHVTGPVMGWLLVPSVLLGGSEIVAHLIQLGFLVAGTIGTARLAIRLGLAPSQAGLAALLVAASPAVLGMASTSMPDIPAMALGVIGIERLTAWRETHRPSAGLAGGILLALAALTRPHLILLLPCAAFWLIRWGRGSSLSSLFSPKLVAKSLWPVALALVIVAVVDAIGRDPLSGGNSARTILSSSGTSGLWWNLASFLLLWAVAFPLTILWTVMRGPAMIRLPYAWVGLVLGTLIALAGGYLPFVVFVGITGAVLGDVLGDAWKRRDQAQIFLGFWLLLAAPTALYGHLPAKFLVPSAPAMALLIARMDLARLRRYRPLITTMAALGVILGVLIIRADAALAEIGRDGGRIVADLVRTGKQVWVDGVWGFQWYAVQAGAQPLATTPPVPAREDLVVTGLHARVLEERYPARTLLYRRVYDHRGGRVMSEGAGFFSNGPGALPWVWGTEELGRIEVWRIDSVPRPGGQ